MRKLLFIYLAFVAVGTVWLGVWSVVSDVQAQSQEDFCTPGGPLYDPVQCAAFNQNPTPPATGVCANGASNYPTCTNLPPNPAAATPTTTPPRSNPPASAQTTGGPALLCDSGTTKNGICLPNNPLGNPTGIAGSGSFTELAAKIIDILLYFAGIVAVIFAIYGGYVYMTSGGNEETASKGRRIITDAIIGLVIVILAYAIITGVTNFIVNK